jgi:hypothetical protein
MPFTLNESYKLVVINWKDAETFGDSGWTTLTEAMTNAAIAPPIMSSVGWVLHSDSHYIAITSDLGPEECGHLTKIPLEMVVSIIELKENYNGEANNS